MVSREGKEAVVSDSWEGRRENEKTGISVVGGLRTVGDREGRKTRMLGFAQVSVSSDGVKFQFS